MGSVIVLEQSLVRSKAWLSLTGAATLVYLIFRTKCQFARRQSKPGKHGPLIINNGQIVFTYREAKSKYGITATRFRRAIDELLLRGFIDITATGMGVHKVETHYAMSERWRDYGTPNFREGHKPRPSIPNPGFRPGNKLWQKAQRKKSSDENAHGAVYENAHGGVLVMHTNMHGQKITTLYKRSNDKWLASKIA